MRVVSLPADRRPLAAAVACLLIIAVGALIRLAGSDWDGGANLHPDERHMMFVVSDTLAAFNDPANRSLSVKDIWFDAEQSPLDPRRNGRLYVYGEFPHMVVSLTALALGQSGWPDVLVLARSIGAIIDSYTILAVFLMVSLATRHVPSALFAAGLYAFSPLALQNANFFAVDIWLTGATAWSVVAAVMVVSSRSNAAALWWAIAGGALAALAVACKLPGLVLFGSTGIACLIRLHHDASGGRYWRLSGALLASGVAALVAFRLVSPFTFTGPGLFGLSPNPAMIENYLGMANQVLDPGFPPNWQWLTGYGAADALMDLVFWGIGPATGIAFLAGLAAMLARPEARRAALGPVVFPIAAFLAYGLLGQIPALRYSLPALPQICAIAGLGVLWVRGSVVGKLAASAVAVVACGWGLGIVSLHTSPHSRVLASQWLWTTTVPGMVLTNESSWDDGLPSLVRLADGSGMMYPDRGGHFRLLTLGMERPDSPEKVDQIVELLGQTDLLAISSDRLRRPIVDLPDRFPMSAAYYRMLASGELCFEPVYTGKPGFPVFGLRLDDSEAQEPWWIYDHPEVEIYRRLDCFDAEATRARLLQALDSGS
jgi:hypothetical protein